MEDWGVGRSTMQCNVKCLEGFGSIDFDCLVVVDWQLSESDKQSSEESRRSFREMCVCERLVRGRGKRRFVDRCGIPTRKIAKSVTQSKSQRRSRLELGSGLSGGPRWDQRSLKCVLGGL